MMTNTVGIVGSNTGAPQQASTGSSAPTPHTDVKAADFTAQIAASQELRESTQSISPRIIVDPVAGAITQFLNTTGQVETQIPSAAVVAYLRAGLTSAGLAKPQEKHQQAESQTANSSIVA
jgi:hypothetical protein